MTYSCCCKLVKGSLLSESQGVNVPLRAHLIFFCIFHFLFMIENNVRRLFRQGRRKVSNYMAADRVAYVRTFLSESEETSYAKERFRGVSNRIKVIKKSENATTRQEHV